MAEMSDFFQACCNNDLKTVQRTVKRSEIDAIGIDGKTALHIAAMYGYADLCRLLLRYRASRTIRDDDGHTPEELAPDEATRNVFKNPVRLVDDGNHFVATSSEIEWLDSYKNAYRISYENHDFMKRWLTKITFQKLLNAVEEYINTMVLSNEKQREKLKELFSFVVECDDALGLLQIYTSSETHFYNIVNRDLAEVGSDFRFVSTQALMHSGFIDNEPPKDLGQYIYAALIINHPRFRPYQYAGTTYRGMQITQNDLAVYATGNIIMTRSFLSTSKSREIAELFINCDSYQTRPPMMCVYKVLNPRSTILIETISQLPDEQEVLIHPFCVFEVIRQIDAKLTKEGVTYSIKEIYLEERNPL